jgi:tol-pal system protein YbgF
MKRLLPFALMALAAAGTVSPAFAADKETRQMMLDIRMLQEQAQQNQTQLAQLVEEIRAMQKALNARIDDQAEAVRKGFADERTVTNQQGNDLRTIIERLNDNTTSIGKNSAEIQALRQLLTSRTMMAPDAGPAPDSTGASAAGAAAAPAGATVPSAAGLSPSQVWDQAYSEYTQGHYDLAVSGFTAFINTFPSAPQAADAQAYICASYYGASQYREAVDACDTVIRSYPKSDKVPYAYYRKGLAYSALRQNDDAKAAFEYVLKNFPSSAEATLADQGLQHLAPPAPAQNRR